MKAISQIICTCNCSFQINHMHKSDSIQCPNCGAVLPEETSKNIINALQCMTNIPTPMKINEGAFTGPYIEFFFI